MQCKRPYVWVSLDEGDNDILRFFTYLAIAIQQVGGVGNRLTGAVSSMQIPEAQILTVAFINDCLDADTDFVLCLDDYHNISNPAVNGTIAYILDNMPPQLHLLITSRADPLLPLPRMRANGYMTELRMHELRFTSSEAAEFLEAAKGLELSEEQIKSLQTRTEGWIAGLQMVALSMRGIRQSEAIAAFIDDFSGSHRHIFDYLTDEVLANQPPDTQSFLLQTSVLGQFNASLCEAVTGSERSQPLLEELDNANLFLVPLDEKRSWYRYHHLFSSLLQRRSSRSSRYGYQIATPTGCRLV